MNNIFKYFLYLSMCLKDNVIFERIYVLTKGEILISKLIFLCIFKVVNILILIKIINFFLLL